MEWYFWVQITNPTRGKVMVRRRSSSRDKVDPIPSEWKVGSRRTFIHISEGVMDYQERTDALEKG